jgi:bacillithiol system protein YtxJ
MSTYQEILSTDTLSEVLKSSGQHPVLIFKHSNSCGVSGRAFGEFQKYLQSPESARVSNYVIVVQKARKASDELARLVGIQHESPQAIIVRDGHAVWNDSHLALKSGRLVEAVGSLGVWEAGSLGV